MPVSNNPSAPVTPNTTTQATTNAQATAATTATPAVETPESPVAAPEIVGDPNASGAPATPTRVAAGYPADFDMVKEVDAGYMGSASNITAGMTGTYISPTSTSYGFRGYTDISKVEATGDGFKLNYTVFSQKKDEEVVMTLQLPARDKATGELSYIPLDLLSHDAATGSFKDKVGDAMGKDPLSGQDAGVAHRTAQFSLKQLNDFVKSKGLGFELVPGAQLALGGIMVGSGHRVANGATNMFAIPKPTGQGAQSPMAARIGNATNQQVKAADMPLDVTVKIPQEVLDMFLNGYSGKKVGDVLEGEITTRLESEYKGSVSKGEMGKMLDSAYELSELSEKADGGDKAARKELDSLLGKGMRISPMKRHWMDEDGVALGNGGDESRVARDKTGRPKLDTMIDAYKDVKDLSWTKISGAIRNRGNAQKSGHAEFKLGGGQIDQKTGIRQRTELGMSTKPGTSEKDLQDVLKLFADRNKAAHYTPAGHIIREAAALGLEGALVEGLSVWADVKQDRHKFEIEDIKTGVKTELSLDTVIATTTRPEHEKDGKPQTETYYVVESELDHLQLVSTNVSEAQSVSSKKAFTTTGELETFFDETKKEVKAGTLELEPMMEQQLHGEEHITEGSFRKTDDYKTFERLNQAVLDATTDGFDPGPARQKAAHFAELIGLVGPEGS